MLYLHRRRSRTSTSNKENRDTGPVLEAAPDIILDLVSSECLTALLRFNISLNTDK